MHKEPLFRKVNTKARGVRHNSGGEYRHDRNTKLEKQSEEMRRSMHGKKLRGFLDYTPLFRFLLSKVGGKWDEIYREAAARLDRPDPIFWLVALHEHERADCVHIGGTTFFSGLYVDEEGRLQLVDPSFGPEKMTPTCRCCTHTLNGKPFPKAYSEEERR